MKTELKYACEEMFLDAASRVASTDFATKIAVARELIDGCLQELLRLGQHDKEQIALIEALFALHCLENYGRTHAAGQTEIAPDKLTGCCDR